ncbi:prolyl oligopeptidase family serine peptidase [Duganella sp. FT80W]|uniref:Prolyl oligopeptidase family serine peptidase n=1 Tax=Duganella guangzhouensis TaxID=2666084 RepID=A0A6I2L1B2_9BURK|nr:alpha/beta hydrolase [Duganella guangzhouensis]MRW90059.1 prolyl oligopeptidase family serine peptidase [Duganella guangzhouensis]
MTYASDTTINEKSVPAQNALDGRQVAALEPSIDIVSRPQPSASTRFRYGNASSQFAELRVPGGSGVYPVVVGIHGGWWRAGYGLETHSHLCHALTEAGYASWNIEYRRLGEPGCTWMETLEDVGSAIDYLARIADDYALDLSRVVTLGFSAGGQLAMWAAARPNLPRAHPLRTPAPLPIKAGVSLAGALDLARCAELGLSNNVVQEFLGGDVATVPHHYAYSSPIELLPLAIPQVLIHGTADSSVPHEISERYAAAASASRDSCELILLPTTGHFELIDPRSDAWDVVHRTVDKLTLSTASASEPYSPLSTPVQSN